MEAIKIFDVGCGPGVYVNAFREAGLIAEGVDLDPRCPYHRLDIFSREFDDLVALGGPYDLCLCLEVAEHLPETRADEFVSKLVKVSDTVLFSAAPPGQGGHGHINCQPKSYWEEKFATHNYVVDAEGTSRIVDFMRSGYHMGWFANNAILFKNYGSVYYETIISEETPQAVRLAEYISAGGLNTPRKG